LAFELSISIFLAKPAEDSINLADGDFPFLELTAGWGVSAGCIWRIPVNKI
jgi:hypothetical protein